MVTRIGFLTGSDWTDWTKGDALLRDALKERGIKSGREVWDEVNNELATYDALIVRSCWDYHKHPDDFNDFLEQLASLEIPIWNSVEVLQWNMNKQYLADLKELGFPIIPSEFFPPGSNTKEIKDALFKRDWHEIVVKPLIGASGYRMERMKSDEVLENEKALLNLVNDRGILIQPFLPEIQSEGEWSFIFFDGQYEFAIHKKPGPDDFRAHNHRGGTYRRAKPKQVWIRHVEQLVAEFPKNCLYQRMDGVIHNDQLTIMEVEALEPSFYFSYYPQGAQALADAIESRFGIISQKKSTL